MAVIKKHIYFLMFLSLSLAINAAEIYSAIPDYSLETLSPSSIVPADMDNDGRNDLIVSFPVDDKKYKIAIFYNLNGTFEKVAGVEIKSNFNYPVKLAIGDFDNDGKNDIAANENKTLHLLLGRDNFQNDISKYNTNNISAFIYPAKITSTGKYDFISSGVIRKWVQNDKLTDGYISPPDKQSANILCIPSDLNNDGNTDIIALPQKENQIRLYYGPFISINIKPMDAAKFRILNFEKPKYVVAGHLNSDINPDIAVSSKETTGIFYQARPIDFPEDIPSVTIDGGGPLLMADFNGDKKDDLAILSLKKNKIFIFLQKDNEFFSEKSAEADCIIPCKKASSFCACDINGDNHTDLIVNDGVSKISIYLNKNK